MSNLEKLTITPKEGPNADQNIEVPFNPNKFSISKGNNWHPATATGAGSPNDQTNAKQNAPPLIFGGGGSRTLSFDLLFDSTEQMSGSGHVDVRSLIKPIVNLGRIIRDLNPPRPPYCLIWWGKSSYPGSDFPFQGVLSQLSESFTLFAPNGTPLRVNLTLAFTEWLDPQNDKLLTDPDFTTRLYKRGDSLSSIAGEVYSDPTQWRVIAEANAIDDPRSVPIGLRLNIPKLH